jgi:hypothetical protein
METENTWYVCDKNGNLAGHDLDEMRAKQTAQTLQEQEPDNEWEAMNKED